MEFDEDIRGQNSVWAKNHDTFIQAHSAVEFSEHQIEQLEENKVRLGWEVDRGIGSQKTYVFRGVSCTGLCDHIVSILGLKMESISG